MSCSHILKSNILFILIIHLLVSLAYSIKDLGVILDSQLSYIWVCVQKLGIHCGELQTYVRSKLEYWSIIWYPFYSSNIESIQRRILKYLALVGKVSDGLPQPQKIHTCIQALLRSTLCRLSIWVLLLVVKQFSSSTFINCIF